MTAPVQPDELTQLLDLVDVSQARTVAIEDQVQSEIDRVYAQQLSSYLAGVSPAQQSGDSEHPLLTAALLTVVVALLRRAFSGGVGEGQRFAAQQVEVVGGRIPDSADVPPFDNSILQELTKDYVSGQHDLITNGGLDPAALTQELAGRAKLGAVTAVQAGRSVAVEQELSQAVGSWSGDIQKMWVARFDQATMPCPLCVRLHGMHVPLGKDFPLHSDEPDPYQGKISRPPRHPQCRCSIVFYLPSKMKDDIPGPSSLSMIMYADRVLELMEADDFRLGFVSASIVYIKPYSRVLHSGHVNFVKGYYFNVDTGSKVPDAQAPKSGVKTVPVSSIHESVVVKDSKAAVSSGVARKGSSSSPHSWLPGSYTIHLPDGNTSTLIAHSDGSGVAAHMGATEKVTSDQLNKFLSYWDGLGKVDKPKTPAAPDIGHIKSEIPTPVGEKKVTLGGQEFAHAHVKSAIHLLKTEKSTSVKGPLKAVNHPMAAVDLRGVAEEHAGTKLHYSKLRKGVVDALQHHLDSQPDDKTVSPAPSKVDKPVTAPLDSKSLTDEQLHSELAAAHQKFAQVRTKGLPTTSVEYIDARDSVKSLESEVASREKHSRGAVVSRESGAVAHGSSPLPVGQVAPAALPKQDVKKWGGLLASAKVAFPVKPIPGDHGSALAAGLQKTASTRHRYYAHVTGNSTKVSMKTLPMDHGQDGHHYMIHSNGSVWNRSLDGDGVEHLAPVSHSRVSQLTESHFSSVDGISLDKAVGNPRALKDEHLDKFMNHSLQSGNMDAFDKLSGEADRRDAVATRKRADDEARAAKLEQLLQSGGHEEDSIEKVYGVSGEVQQRKAAISALRSDGYVGVNLSELGRKAYKDYVYQLYLQAEDSMQGHMLSKEGEAKGMSPLTLFTGPESRMTKYASPELIDWFEAHGRVKYSEWLHNYLGKFSSAPV